MKTTRQQLKAIVKECLIEILNEGLGGRVVEAADRRSVFGETKMHRDPVLDRPAHREQPKPTMALAAAVKAEAGGNHVMEQILADTASTTLQKQLRASGPNGEALAPAGGVIESIVAEHTPDQIFGDETTSKWSQLAFASPPRNK